MEIGLVVAEFNREVTEEMERRARAAASELGVDVAVVNHVPGAYDAPLAVKNQVERGVDAVAVLGAVVTGDTGHDEVIARVVADRLSELSLEHDVPVALGVSGPEMTADEARERVYYGRRAVESAVSLARELDD
ncbi:MAG: 6,7-dimethyl-8-ribityllumazine synthase [Halobacteriota archaeon]